MVGVPVISILFPSLLMRRKSLRIRILTFTALFLLLTVAVTGWARSALDSELATLFAQMPEEFHLSDHHAVMAKFLVSQ